jgi:Tol biopolymer transport system component
MRDGKPAGNRPFMLHLGQADGTGPTRVLATTCEETVAWSPDSKRLAFGVVSNHSSRVYLINIDGTGEELILEKAGDWLVQDWSPDGKKLLLEVGSLTVPSAPTSELLEYDLTGLERYKKGTFPGAPWQSGIGTSLLLRPVVGGSPSHLFSGGRYSPDGKSIAVTASKRPDKPSSAYALPNFELGVIDRAKATYQKVVSYPGEGYGLRGPLCWSPDGTAILYSRPLAKDDGREKGAGDAGAPAGLGIWAIKADGTGERFLTTGWAAEWR